MKLDKIDIRILCELQKNGRISNVELAELINLSPSPCLMRVKRLQTEGFITGYSAQVDVSKLGQTLTVFAEITLKNHRQIDFARFLTTVEKIDSVVECHLVSGGYDYLVKFITAGISEYQALMERLVEMDIGIDKYFSFVVLKSPIVKSHLPLESIFNGWRTIWPPIGERGDHPFIAARTSLSSSVWSSVVLVRSMMPSISASVQQSGGA
jgi:DNA-binding Lrp family transcriptional regulator